MPIAVKTDSARDLTLCTATGELTFHDQVAVLKSFYEGNPTRNLLWDMRQISGARITSQEITDIIEFINSYKEKRLAGKTALVTATDLDFGMSRMSELLAESSGIPWEIRAFHSLDDALSWIDEG
ncbi:MAG: hypothetical protein ACP5G0_04270 [Desulfomonilia bacterium]